MAENIATHTHEGTPTDPATDQAAVVAQPPEQTPQTAEPQAEPTVDPAKTESQAPEAQAEDKEAQAEATEPAAAASPEEATQGPDTRALQVRVIEAELRAAAALAGVPANKLAYVTRLADHSAALEAEDPAQYAAQQIKQIMQDFPELGSQPAATGSAGNHARQDAVDPEAEAIKAGFKQRY